MVRKSAPIKHVSPQMNTLVRSLQGFLKINEIICVTWLQAFLSTATAFIFCMVVAFENASKPAISTNVIVRYSLMEVVRFKREEGIL